MRAARLGEDAARVCWSELSLEGTEEREREVTFPSLLATNQASLPTICHRDFFSNPSPITTLQYSSRRWRWSLERGPMHNWHVVQQLRHSPWHPQRTESPFFEGGSYALTDVCLFYLLRNRRQTDRPLLTEVVRHATLLSRQIKPDWQPGVN